MSLFDLSSHGDAPALLEAQGRSLSYRELDRLVAPLGSLLSAGGKSCLLVLAGNNLETIAGYLAALESGNCAMLVDEGLDPALREELIRLYDPEFVWGPDPGDPTSPFRFGAYALSRRAGSRRSALPGELAPLLCTPGSTDAREVVRLRAGGVIANARSIASYLSLNAGERPMAHLPVHYCYGLSVINSHLLVGAAISLSASSVTRKEFWEQFVSAGCTSLAGVPYTFEMLTRIGFWKMELPTLRYLTQAGGKMDAAKTAEWAGICADKGAKFFVMYGATEATARMAYLPPEHATRKPGSIGKAVPGGELALVDDCGAALTVPHLQGELVYRGANVMMGYAACRDDLSRGDDLGGTLPTGDLACFDEDGFYYICGRRSRFVKILGKRFGLGDLEDYLARSGWICVCGGADDRLLVAWHRDNQDVGGAALGELKRKLCTTFNIPGDLVQMFQIGDIPRTPSGKIRYGEIFAACTTSKEGGYDGRDEQSEG